MEAPRQLRQAADQGEDISITHREYDDESVVVVDFGADVDATVDVVGDTAIVVAGDSQYEFEVPSGATEVSTNDGILTITSRPGDADQVDESAPSDEPEQ